MAVQSLRPLLGLKLHRYEWLHLQITGGFVTLSSYFSVSGNTQLFWKHHCWTPRVINLCRTTARKVKQNHPKHRSLQHRIRDTLTYSKLLSKDCFLSQCRAVPPPVPKLVLALIDSHLCPFPDHNDGIRAALADRSLPRGQAWDFVADYISS